MLHLIIDIFHHFNLLLSFLDFFFLAKHHLVEFILDDFEGALAGWVRADLHHPQHLESILDRFPGELTLGLLLEEPTQL